MTFEDDPKLVEQDEPMRNSGLSAMIPFSIAALVLGAVIVFYGTNGGQFTISKSAPPIAQSKAPSSGAPQTSAR
jgi:hypothetical protein